MSIDMLRLKVQLMIGHVMLAKSMILLRKCECGETKFLKQELEHCFQSLIIYDGDLRLITKRNVNYLEVSTTEELEVNAYCSECEEELQVYETQFDNGDILVYVEPHLCKKET